MAQAGSLLLLLLLATCLGLAAALLPGAGDTSPRHASPGDTGPGDASPRDLSSGYASRRYTSPGAPTSPGDANLGSAGSRHTSTGDASPGTATALAPTAWHPMSLGSTAARMLLLAMFRAHRRAAVSSSGDGPLPDGADESPAPTSRSTAAAAMALSMLQSLMSHRHPARNGTLASEGPAISWGPLDASKEDAALASMQTERDVDLALPGDAEGPTSIVTPGEERSEERSEEDEDKSSFVASLVDEGLLPATYDGVAPASASMSEGGGEPWGRWEESPTAGWSSSTSHATKRWQGGGWAFTSASRASSATRGPNVARETPSEMTPTRTAAMPTAAREEDDAFGTSRTPTTRSVGARGITLSSSAGIVTTTAAAAAPTSARFTNPTAKPSATRLWDSPPTSHATAAAQAGGDFERSSVGSEVLLTSSEPPPSDSSQTMALTGPSRDGGGSAFTPTAAAAVAENSPGRSEIPRASASPAPAISSGTGSWAKRLPSSSSAQASSGSTRLGAGVGSSSSGSTEAPGRRARPPWQMASSSSPAATSPDFPGGSGTSSRSVARTSAGSVIWNDRDGGDGGDGDDGHLNSPSITTPVTWPQGHGERESLSIEGPRSTAAASTAAAAPAAVATAMPGTSVGSGGTNGAGGGGGDPTPGSAWGREVMVDVGVGAEQWAAERDTWGWTQHTRRDAGEPTSSPPSHTTDTRTPSPTGNASATSDPTTTAAARGRPPWHLRPRVAPLFPVPGAAGSAWACGGPAGVGSSLAYGLGACFALLALLSLAALALSPGARHFPAARVHFAVSSGAALLLSSLRAASLLWLQSERSPPPPLLLLHDAALPCPGSALAALFLAMLAASRMRVPLLRGTPGPLALLAAVLAHFALSLAAAAAAGLTEAATAAGPTAATATPSPPPPRFQRRGEPPAPSAEIGGGLGPSLLMVSRALSAAWGLALSLAYVAAFPGLRRAMSCRRKELQAASLCKTKLYGLALHGGPAGAGLQASGAVVLLVAAVAAPYFCLCFYAAISSQGLALWAGDEEGDEGLAMARRDALLICLRLGELALCLAASGLALYLRLLHVRWRDVAPRRFLDSGVRLPPSAPRHQQHGASRNGDVGVGNGGLLQVHPELLDMIDLKGSVSSSCRSMERRDNGGGCLQDNASVSESFICVRISEGSGGVGDEQSGAGGGRQRSTNSRHPAHVGVVGNGHGGRGKTGGKAEARRREAQRDGESCAGDDHPDFPMHLSWSETLPSCSRLRQAEASYLPGACSSDDSSLMLLGSSSPDSSSERKRQGSSYGQRQQQQHQQQQQQQQHHQQQQQQQQQQRQQGHYSPAWSAPQYDSEASARSMGGFRWADADPEIQDEFLQVCRDIDRLSDSIPM
uniref:Mucin-5AC-like n=1 Tax=Petromyzon marinus TaxID=7757 RepID=A0AAJ7T2G7_PETMA|nr:mucin-5AC-like [Petromyzon marinus]XP_032809995.1 mucin-5AC-like [Petromyzon marinus]